MCLDVCLSERSVLLLTRMLKHLCSTELVMVIGVRTERELKKFERW